jgi:hypothetical protein
MIEAELDEISHAIKQAEEHAKAVSSMLAPVKRRRDAIKNEIAWTYVHRERSDGKIEIVGFTGEIKTVRSNRIIGIRAIEDGQQVFEYGEVARDVVIPDRDAIAQRKPLFEELIRITEHYGKQFEEERRCYREVDNLRKAMARMIAARDKDRRKARASRGTI